MTTVFSRHGSATQPARRPRTADVAVNGVRIPRADIAREVQHHPAPTPAEAWAKAARAIVVRELLLQEARRLEIAAVPLEDAEGRRETADEALVRCLIEREVRTPDADEAACRRYFDMNRSRFRSHDLWEVSHILIAAHPDDETRRAPARQTAEALIAELRRPAGALSFEAAAAAVSACPSGKVGGSLRQIGPGQTVPELEAALPDLPIGSVAPQPVETRYGFHVVRLDRKLEGEELPFELVRNRIADWLAERSRRTAIRQYLAILVGRATIEGIELPATAGSLVQ